KKKNAANPLVELVSQVLRVRELALVTMIILIAFSLELYTGRFFTPLNINAISLGFSTSAVMVFGMTMALVSGGFDLSVGSVFALGGVVAGTALKAGLPIPVAILLGLS